MIDKVQELLEKNSIKMLRTIPSALMILVDTVGYWDVTDFDIVWLNAPAKHLLGNSVATGKIKSSSKENLNKRLKNSQSIRQQIMTGSEGFIGPFKLATLNADKKPVHVEYHAMYLGEIGSDLPAFLVFVQDKTIEVTMLSKD